MANTYFCWFIYVIIIVAHVPESCVYFSAYVSTFMIMEMMVYNVIYYYHYFQNCDNTVQVFNKSLQSSDLPGKKTYPVLIPVS